MQLVQVINQQQFWANADGTELTTDVDTIIDALSAKNMAAYVQVHTTDGDTDVTVSWQHSPEGKLWVNTTSVDLYSGTSVSTGMKSDATERDVTFAAKIRLQVKVAQGTPSSAVRTSISVWLVLKPF